MMLIGLGSLTAIDAQAGSRRQPGVENRLLQDCDSGQNSGVGGDAQSTILEDALQSFGAIAEHTSKDAALSQNGDKRAN